MNDNQELIKLWSNNEKRQAFLKTYKDWNVLAITPELGLTYYSYIVPDGSVIIAMEHRARKYDYESKGYICTRDTRVRYYIRSKDEPFTPDSETSVWAVADLLKDAKVKLQKMANE
jgi:hypothetical protein